MRPDYLSLVAVCVHNYKVLPVLDGISSKASVYWFQINTTAIVVCEVCNGNASSVDGVSKFDTFYDIVLLNFKFSTSFVHA